jgi:hypothetical protein
MTNGTVMLGYLDPDASIGDAGSQFVYYSNIRVVELSPYITNQIAGRIVTNGANITFTSAATYASVGITNMWFTGPTTTNAVNLLQTDFNATASNLVSTLSLTSVTTGTNYLNVFSDMAGSVTSVVAQVEVITPPTSLNVYAGSNSVQFVVGTNGPTQPTYIWKTNGVSLVNGSHYSGVTNNVLTINNVELIDGNTYTCFVTNSAGGLAVAATLTVSASSPTFTGISTVGPTTFLNFTSTNGYDNTNSYTLLGSTNVQGPYTAVSATNIGLPGSFQFKLPKGTNATMFYRLLHN